MDDPEKSKEVRCSPDPLLVSCTEGMELSRNYASILSNEHGSTSPFQQVYTQNPNWGPKRWKGFQFNRSGEVPAPLGRQLSEELGPNVQQSRYRQDGKWYVNPEITPVPSMTRTDM